MSNYYGLVENWVIKRINIELPTVINGTHIPAGAVGLDVFNLYPIIGNEPQFDQSTQRISGPSYEFNGHAVVRAYTVEQIPESERMAAIHQAISDEMQRKIREKYALEDEQYFARIGVGVALGVYEFQAGEREALLEFGAFVESIRQWGRDERAKLAL